MAYCAILCGGGEPSYSSSQGFLHALKAQGHDVWTAGRAYFGRSLCDLELPDKPHPEYYSYQEVLDKCPWTPDLAICFDPGSFFNGSKPKGLKSVFISTDAHRCGELLRRVIKEGSYDLFVNLQPNYSHFFTDLIKVHTSIPAFDDRRFSINEDAEPVCDVVFCGQTGLALTEDHWKTPDGEDDAGRYISNLADRLSPDQWKYEFSYLPSWDYSERGELLYRLSQDFDVRIYEPLWDEKLQVALQKGRVGINYSILQDYSLRNLEVAAAGRPLVTDRIWEGNNPPYPPSSYLFTSGLYRPFYANFSLIYQQAKKAVGIALQKSALEKARDDREFVFFSETWKNRALEVLRVMKLG